MTEAEASKKIVDKVYAAREQIYEETKNLADKEYAAYFNNHAQVIITRNGYTAVRSNDGMGYTLQMTNN
jgi:hypothetical protein